ncbi:hypothetical protein ACT8ZS_14705 [Paenibacillus sp. M.A.Huq-84]
MYKDASKTTMEAEMEASFFVGKFPSERGFENRKMSPAAFWMLLKCWGEKRCSKAAFNLEETRICRAAAERKEIDGNPHANPAWISPEINLTGKTNSNRGDMLDISQNT